MTSKSPQSPADEPEAGPAADTAVERPEPRRTRKTTEETEDTVAEPGTAPYPGEQFFHAGRHSRLLVAMGRRLMAEDCGHYIGSPRPEWTHEHARSYAAWQTRQGVEPTSVPDATTWAALRVPATRT